MDNNLNDSIEQSLAQAKQPQPSQNSSLPTVEESLAEAQPPKSTLQTAGAFADYYYGAMKTEASKLLSAFNVGFQDNWGHTAYHSQDEDTQKTLQEHGVYKQYQDQSKNAWYTWSTIARQTAAETANYGLRAAEATAHGVFNVLDQASSDIGQLPSESDLLKLGYKPQEIKDFYKLAQSEGGPLKAGFHAFERSIVPAYGSIKGAIYGGRLGAAAGALIPGAGETGISEAIGGFAGAVAGGIGGYQAVDKAQQYLLSKLPETWQKWLGQHPAQVAHEETEHPIASFTGSLMPFAAGFRPGLKALPTVQNASWLVKSLATPLGQRALSAVLFGDFEALQELWSEGKTDSDKVAIATAVGALLPRNEAEARVAQLEHRSNDQHIEPTFNKAKAEGVIGVNTTPEQQSMKDEAIANLEPHETANPASVFDIHQAAREIAPDTFKEYDELLARQEQLRSQIKAESERLSPEAQAAQDKIDQILSKVNGVEARLTKKASERLAAARSDLETAMSMPSLSENLQALKEEHLSNFNRLRDYLSPDIRRAYKYAAEQAPKPVETHVEPEPRPLLDELIQEQNQSIAEETSNRLQAVGRPKEEADNIGQLVQAYFETRAKRFQGKLGTPLELFNKEFPEIRHGDTQATDANTLEQLAYHGSGADFDKFDPRYMSTGGGAQMYGVGHYFTDQKSKADYYAQEGKRKTGTGVSYTVDLKPKEYEWLDADKKLPEQSEYVQERLKSAGLWNGDNITVRELQANIAAKELFSESVQQARADASEVLKRAGIPGIRYEGIDHKFQIAKAEVDLIKAKEDLELAKKAPKTGRVSELEDKIKSLEEILKGRRDRNYVVFDPENVSIEGKEYHQEEDNNEAHGYVAFHGTNRNFDQFNEESRGRLKTQSTDTYSNLFKDSNLATFFTSDPEIASDYANYSSIFKNEEGERGVGQNVRRVHLNLENPKIINLNGEQYNPEKYTSILTEAKLAGHDGVIFKNANDAVLNTRGKIADVYAVFDLNKIRSINSNFELYQNAPIFYSALSRGVEALKQSSATPDQWLSSIKNLKGVKKEEIEWSGIEEWLKSQKGKVSKSDLQKFLEENNVKVQEVERKNDVTPTLEDKTALNIRLSRLAENQGLPFDHYMELTNRIVQLDQDAIKEAVRLGVGRKYLNPFLQSSLPTRHGQHVLPGGKDYRELLLTLPEKPLVKLSPSEYEEYKNLSDRLDNGEEITPEEDIRLTELIRRDLHNGYLSQNQDFRSSHWEQPNVLAHVRFDTRTGPNGEKILHLAEVQSDWMQRWRKLAIDAAIEDGIIKDKKEWATLSNEVREKYFNKVSEGERRTPEEEKQFLQLNKINEQLNSYAERIRQIKRELRVLEESENPENDDLINALTLQLEDLNKKSSELDKNFDYELFRRLQDKERLPEIPKAPFKQSWQELALKRMLRYASENGYDRLSWDTGETNADRYDLSRQVKKLQATLRPDGKIGIQFWDHIGQNHHLSNAIEPEKLDDFIGKEAADKIKERFNKGEGRPGALGTKVLMLEGLDLKIGGEGMKGFYDKILPDFIRKYTKKWGAKVEDTTISVPHYQQVPEPLDDGRWAVYIQGDDHPTEIFKTKQEALDAIQKHTESKQVHSVTITPEMKESVLKSQPLFQKQRRGSLTIRMPSQANILKVFKNANASTVVHELGHDWLEALFRDASHPEAPDQLLADSKIVRDWYNEKRTQQNQHWYEDGVIPRAAHEMWARGFERYLMEGVAPSKGLANVFAKFKAWLTKIYQTVTRLRAPITDDVRGVFDRLLSTEPETIVAPEEASSVEASHESIEGRTASSEEPKISTPKELTPDQEALVKAIPQEDDPGLSYNQSEVDRYINKDGTFRVHQITNYAQLSKGIKAYITKNLNKIEARKGKLTNSDIIDYASSMGLDPSKADISILKKLFPEEDVPLAGLVFAVGQWMKDSTKAMVEALENGTEEEYLTARQNLVTSMEIFNCKLRPDWGRAGKAFQLLYKYAESGGTLDEFLKDNTGKTFDQLKSEMKRMRRMAKQKGVTLAELIKQQRTEVKVMENPRWGDYINELFRNNLITGLFTHLFYAESNKINGSWRQVAMPASQIGVSKLLGREGEQIAIGELAEVAYNLKYAQTEALRAFGKSFKAGQSLGIPPLRVAEEKVDYEIANGITNASDRDARINYWMENATPEMILKGAPPKLTLTQTKVFPNFKYFPLGSIIRFGGERLAAPLHTEAYVFSYHLAQARLIYREAYNQGLRDDALALEIARLKYDTPLKIVEAARREALKATLLSDESQLGKYLTGLSRYISVGGIQPLVVFEPFVKIVADIFHQAWTEYLPISGALHTVFGGKADEIHKNALGKNGKIAQAETVGNLVLGIALMGAVAGWMEQGVFNGPEPDDKKTASVKKMTTGYPYSFNIGNLSFPAARFGPLGVAVSLASDIIAAGKAADVTHPEFAKFQHAAWLTIHNLGKELLSIGGVLAGFSQLNDVINDENKMKQWGQRTLPLFEPGSILLSQIARETDPYVREAHGYLQQLMKQTPGLSQELQPAVDIWGTPIPNEKFYGVYVQQIHTDPVMQYFERHPEFFPSRPQRRIDGVELTDDQYYEYRVKSGVYMKQALNRDITPEFETLPKLAQKNIIEQDIRAARTQAKTELQIKYPDLLKQHLDQLNKMLQKETPTE